MRDKMLHTWKTQQLIHLVGNNSEVVRMRQSQQPLALVQWNGGACRCGTM
jgi:hypothetical protein